MKAGKVLYLLLSALMLFAVFSPAASANTAAFDAAIIDGKVYVDAEQVAHAFGGIGTYDANAKKYIFSPNQISDVIENLSPSVVAIIGRYDSQEDDMYAAGRYSLSHGTGVILSDDGWIVTNAHVVKDLVEMVVVTADGKQLVGRTHAMDEESDLALVKVNALKLPAASIASSPVRVGETVIAIGTPISFSLRNSATVGVVSGVERSINATYQLLQTDAAINPGNSGGPLVNMKGEVIGINTLKYVDFGVESMGFAIPASTVVYVTEQLKEHGTVRRAYLGADLSEGWAAVVGLPSNDPLTIDYVEKGGPADKAGLREGDELVSLDGRKFSTVVEFNELLKGYAPGSTADLQIISEGKSKTVSITFGLDPRAQKSASDAQDTVQHVDIWTQIGYSTALINGEKHKLEAPVVHGGHTLVSPDLFVLAYGEYGQWDREDDTVIIALGEHRFEMTIGQTTAFFDDETVELTAAPRLQNGTPMVPFRFIAEQLGMELDFYAHTKELTISGQLDEEGRFTNTSSLNRDGGKSKIGDSFYGWTINYPTNLYVSYQDASGSTVYFYDINGAYSLTVTAEKISGSPPSGEALLNRLANRAYGQITTRSYERNAEVPYAKVIVKQTYGGSYAEYRAYTSEDYIYFVTMTIYAEDDYSNERIARSLQRLMNSFRPQFDESDETIKDLSRISDGFRNHRLSDLGLSFLLPAGWSDYYGMENARFINEETYEEELNIRLRSIAQGDTLEAWVGRVHRMMESTIREEYRKIGDPEPVTVSGYPALYVRYDMSEDARNWNRSDIIYVFADQYKYQFSFDFPKGYDRDADQVVEKFVESLDINLEGMDASFGVIEDEYDTIDLNKTMNVTSADYQMSFEVPEYWDEYAASDSYEYYFNGGSFSVSVDEYESFDDIVQEVDRLLKSDFSGVKVIESLDTTVSGARAKKWVFENTLGPKETYTQYLIDYNDRIYGISYSITEAAATRDNLARLEAAFKSFRFTE